MDDFPAMREPIPAGDPSAADDGALVPRDLPANDLPAIVVAVGVPAYDVGPRDTAA